MKNFHKDNFIIGRIGANEPSMSNRVGYLLNTVGSRLAIKTYQIIRDELIYGCERHSSDWSACLLGLYDF